MSNKNKRTDIMIDIETLDTKPTAVILSMAAILFNLEEGTISNIGIYASFVRSTQLERGRTIDVDTILWWGQQNEEAREAAFKEQWELEKVLKKEFVDFLKSKTTEDVRVWAKSPSFDLVILKDALGDTPAPWKYSNERDVRTLLALFPDLKTPENPKPHHPYYDCEGQVIQVIEAYNTLKNLQAI